MADPVLSVVICNHRPGFIEACLESLRQSVGVRYEVIVVTSDPAYETLRGEIVLREAGGPAHKRNVGVRASHGAYIVFLDDDTEVSPYTLYEFYHGFHALPSASMLFARIYNGERRSELDDCGSWLTPTGFLYARASNQRISHDELMQPVRCLASKSAGCAIRREWFYTAGGFDASYFILGEESDLAWRVWLHGGEVHYWPHAVLWHWFNTSTKPVQDYYTLRRIHTYGCRNYLRFLTTNLGLLRLLWILPLHAVIWLVAAGGFLLRRQPLRAACILQGLWGFLSTWQQTAAKRRQVQAGRLVADRDLLPIIMRRVSWDYYPQRMAQYIFNGLHG